MNNEITGCDYQINQTTSSRQTVPQSRTRGQWT